MAETVEFRDGISLTFFAGAAGRGRCVQLTLPAPNGYVAMSLTEFADLLEQMRESLADHGFRG